MIRRLAAATIVAGALVAVGAPDAGARTAINTTKEGVCIRIEGSLPDYCMSDPIGPVLDSLPKLPTG